MGNEPKRPIDYYDILGIELDDEASREERTKRNRKRKPEFRNGQFTVSGLPLLDDDDADSD